MKIKEKSDLGKLHNFLKKEFGYLPSPKELKLVIGGDPADWGRILNGQQKIAGEYYARLKCVKDVGLENAQFELLAAGKSKKYGGVTRNGRIVPHARKVIDDMYFYNLEKKTSEQIENRVYLDEIYQYEDYVETGELIEARGLHYPKDNFEDQALRREFINSLS